MLTGVIPDGNVRIATQLPTNTRLQELRARADTFDDAWFNLYPAHIAPRHLPNAPWGRFTQVERDFLRTDAISQILLQMDDSRFKEAYNRYASEVQNPISSKVNIGSATPFVTPTPVYGIYPEATTGEEMELIRKAYPLFAALRQNEAHLTADG